MGPDEQFTALPALFLPDDFRLGNPAVTFQVQIRHGVNAIGKIHFFHVRFLARSMEINSPPRKRAVNGANASVGDPAVPPFVK
jgi:hypothetical protein